MAKIIIPGGNDTYVADQANTTYVLKHGTTIDTTDAVGIDGFYSTPGRTFLINGTITSAAGGMRAGTWNGLPENINVTIGASGRIESVSNGVNLGGMDSSVVNKGTIESTSNQDRGIASEGHDNLIDNQGTITGYIGIASIGDNNEITNSGRINAVYQGVLLNSTDGQHNRMINSGTIRGVDANSLSYAVFGAGGDEHVINSGRIVGDVYLQGGDDTFVSKGGILKGMVLGGDGDDIYVIDSAIDLVENTGEGFDRVRTSVSYTLAANIEEATLTGKANINLTGTESADLLYGNKGANRIIGGNGLDYITGNGGNDRLTGGPGSGIADVGDIFVFRAGSDHDVITDFQDGLDVINLGNYTGIDTFDDLHGKISQVGDDVMIRLLDGDSIRLLHTDRTTIGIDDFDF